MSARSHGSRTMSARSHGSTTNPDTTWSSMSHTIGDNSTKPPALATDEDINRSGSSMPPASSGSRKILDACRLEERGN